MGKKVFLSYAEEDSKIASEIVEKFRNAGLEVFYWQNPEERGKRFIPWIEKKIPDADAFIALLSNSFQGSDYCQREKEMAVQLDSSRGSQFIYVVLVGAVDLEKADFLGPFDRFDLTGGQRQQELERLINILGGDSNMMPDSNNPRKLYQPDFQNREEELDELFSNLTKPSGGVYFWQILAPPQMGKSWLLDHLSNDLLTNGQPWEVQKLSLRSANSLALRCDVAALLSAFLSMKIANPLGDAAITKIARKIAGSGKFWLLSLDDAELLNDKTAEDLRNILSQIDSRLRSHERVRLAFVAATRRHFELWIKVSPEHSRFKSRPLSPFTVNVISQALKEMADQDGINKGQEWLDDMAKALHWVTEGLPALLVRYLDWIKKQAYIFDHSDLESQELFNELVKPYIEETILSPDSLLLGEGDANRIRPQWGALISTLSGLCLYRRFIARYIADWTCGDENLANNLRQLSWETGDLQNALKRTYITEPVPNDLWTVFYPAIRRLLFRYFYGDLVAQTEVQERACLFYQDRWREWDGTDRAIVLLEHLWHQMEYQRLSAKPNLPHNIKMFADALFKAGKVSALYSPQEIAEIIKTRMSGDEEFQNTAHQIDPQLSDQLAALL